MKSIIKRAMATLIIVAVLLSCMNIGAFAASYPRIYVGDTVKATANEKMGRLALEFIPEETGAYAFYSMGDYDTVGYIFDSQKNLLAENDDYEDLNFFVTYYMIAGESYILRSEFLANDGTGEYTVSLKKLPEPEEIFIFHGGETTGYVDSYLSLECMTDPEEAFCGNCTWESDNEDVALIDYAYGSYCDIYLLSAGTANITVTTDTGFTDSVEIRCIEIPEIEKDIPQALSFGVMGGSRLFSFTPEVGGVYSIYTDGAAMPMIVLLDSEWEMLAMNDYRENMLDAVISESLVANRTYYIQVYTFMESPDFDLYVTECPRAESVQILCDDGFEGYRAMSLYLYTSFSPDLAFSESCTWSSSNEDVAMIFEDDGYCEVLLIDEGSADITVTTESGLTDTVTVECVPVDEIRLNEKVKVNAVEGAVYKFVPEKNGVYAFVSEGDAYAFGAIFSGGWDIIDGNLGTEPNFSVQAEMMAEAEYYVVTYAFTADHDYNVLVTECEQAKSVSFNEGSVVYGHVGDELTLSIGFDSDTAIREGGWFSSNDPKIANVNLQGGEGYECTVSLNQLGTAEITVETENGLVATCTVIVTDIEYTELSCDRAYTVNTDKYLYEYFEFVPSEDGRYSFYSKGDLDTYVEVYDGDMNYISDDDDSGSDYNFCVRLDMKAGERYVFRTYCFDRTSTEYTVAVVKAKAADGMNIAGDRTVYASVGDIISFSAEFTPDGAEAEDVYWRVSDRGVVQVMSDEGQQCYLIVEGEGTATVTASTDSGFYDYVTVVVGEQHKALGDVNGDGSLNAQDTNLLKRYIAGTYNDIVYENSDINGDGKIDAIDSNLLKRLLAGK